MGRFETTAEFYARYREPYTEQFFSTVAHQLGFKNSDRLLDVGCGPGLLALGFAPYAGQCTGIDPEPNMLAAAKENAEAYRIHLTLVHSRVEDFSPASQFEIVTIGRALHWLDREAALASIDQLLAPLGRVLICGASTDKERTPWLRAYNELRDRYADLDSSRYKLDGTQWFAGTPFQQVADILVPESHTATIDELIGRSHSKSNTSPAILGERRPAFEREMRELLEGFAQGGPLREEVVGRATVFQR